MWRLSLNHCIRHPPHVHNGCGPLVWGFGISSAWYYCLSCVCPSLRIPALNAYGVLALHTQLSLITNSSLLFSSTLPSTLYRLLLLPSAKQPSMWRHWFIPSSEPYCDILGSVSGFTHGWILANSGFATLIHSRGNFHKNKFTPRD